KRLKFAHPSGIPYTLVGTSEDTRRGYGGGGVDPAHGIKGAYAPLISVIDNDEMVLYLETGIGAKKVAEDGAHQAWDLEGEKFGSRIELIQEPDVRPGTWHFAEGTPHHWAWNVSNEDNQMSLKGYIEGLGYTDVTEQKDRGYFLSIYNRTPGGALFEYAFTPADRGFLIDEPEDKLGTEVQIPPPFAHLADEMIAWLDPIEDRSRWSFAGACGRMAVPVGGRPVRLLERVPQRVHRRREVRQLLEVQLAEPLELLLALVGEVQPDDAQVVRVLAAADQA